MIVFFSPNLLNTIQIENVLDAQIYIHVEQNEKENFEPFYKEYIVNILHTVVRLATKTILSVLQTSQCLYGNLFLRFVSVRYLRVTFINWLANDVIHVKWTETLFKMYISNASMIYYRN